MLVIRRDPDVSEAESLRCRMTSRERTAFTFAGQWKRSRQAAVAFAASAVNKRAREKMRNVCRAESKDRNGYRPFRGRSGEFPAKEGTSVSVYALIHDPAVRLIEDHLNPHVEILCART